MLDSESNGAPSPTSGIVIAVISSFINGSTFVLHKKGISRARDKGGSYLGDAVWWTGTLFMIIGQMGNFLAYNLAPAVVVTPLGALGVLFGAVLASRVLQERLNILGKLGCVLCCSGSVVLIIHAPKTAAVTSRLQLEERLSDPVFLMYAGLVLSLLLVLIVWITPAHGASNIMVYVAICSLLGTFTVTSSKGLGLVAQDVFAPGPWNNRAVALFLGLVGTLVVSILTQFIFINKAMENFSANIFEAIYYVTFTSAAILASALLFREWVSLTASDSLAMFCGLTTVCAGVVLLNISQEAVLTWRLNEGRKKTE